MPQPQLLRLACRALLPLLLGCTGTTKETDLAVSGGDNSGDSSPPGDSGSTSDGGDADGGADSAPPTDSGGTDGADGTDSGGTDGADGADSGGTDGADGADGSGTVDADSDGHAEADDCDDSDPEVHPGATEQCNDVDDNCDGEVDEAGASGESTWYRDGDADGHGDPDTSAMACEAPLGFVSSADDCDDSEPQAFPGADEYCDGFDNNCDAEIDEAGAVDEASFYRDADGDGHGDASLSVVDCAAPSGFVALDDDCDDNSLDVYPGAPEQCNGVDDDCSGAIDDGGATATRLWYRDLDGDGWGQTGSTLEDCARPSGYAANPGDCDDSLDSVNPGEDERCNGVDDNCDSAVDGSDSVDAGTWYLDADLDGYGDPTSSTLACLEPVGYASDLGGFDCDDSDDSYHPGAAEEDCADPADYNCDGRTGYSDGDSDGFAACEECDDADAEVNPEAEEVCDGEDNNCDGLADDEDPALLAASASDWYLDGDGDGYGLDSALTAACAAPAGHVAEGGDCDDAEEAAFPGGIEVCDDLDNNCDGTTDESSALDARSWYTDADTDGYGRSGSSALLACDAPAGRVSNDEDCDDSRASVSPADAEICNGRDDDCDGSADESDATDASTWYRDSDSDGYGLSSDSLRSCTLPAGYTSTSGDCDDSLATVSPADAETCNGRDDDCDSTVDEGVTTTYFLDTDGDGFGDPARTGGACSLSAGYAANDDDCDDSSSAAAATWPGSAAYDSPTACMTDLDGDGFGDDSPASGVSAGTDCDDASAAVMPDADEVCDDVDNDCDGLTDDSSSLDARSLYLDADADGYGLSSSTALACPSAGYTATAGDCDDSDDHTFPGAADEDSATVCMTDLDGDGYGDLSPAGGVSAGTDCDDGVPTAHPGGSELCNDADDDCNGLVDDGSPSGAATFYEDADLDGYGVSTSTVSACDAPSGYSSRIGDCDDEEFTVNPGRLETCNDGLDNDCDGLPGSCLLSGSYDLATHSGAVYHSDAASDHAGSALAWGDVTGDGEVDLIIGAPDADSGGGGAGSSYVLPGPLDSEAGNVDLGSATELYGNLASEYAGTALAAADFDGDGVDDLLIGAIGLDPTGRTDGGGAYLMYGPLTSDVDLVGADLLIMGSARTDGAGNAVAMGGDTDGDGVAELLIGAALADPGGFTSGGSAYLIEGPLSGPTYDVNASTTIVLNGPSANYQCGKSVAFAGDIDSDGMDDVLVGAWYSDFVASDAGMVSVLYGPIEASMVLSSADGTLTGESAYDYLGFAVTGVGDVTGDGHDDILVGAYGDDDGGSAAGAAYLVPGPTIGFAPVNTIAAAKFYGQEASDQAGWSVSAGGDLDGDGNLDVVVGAPNADPVSGADQGVVYGLVGPYSGNIDLQTAYDMRWVGMANSDYAGRAVLGGGDITGDGVDDLIIGAPYQTSMGGTDGGTAYLIEGLTW